MPRPSIPAALFFTVWFTGWTCGTSPFDIHVYSTFPSQLHALSYPTAAAHITASTLRTTQRSKGGATYEPILSYSFEINSVTYTSAKLRADQSWSKPDAEKFVAAHPPNSDTTVYYDPENPSDCLLQPGLNADDFMQLIFATPINAGWLGAFFILLATVANAGPFAPHRLPPPKPRTRAN